MKKPIVARIDEELHRAVKMKAVREGMTMTEIVKQLLAAWVADDDIARASTDARRGSVQHGKKEK